MNSQNSSPWFAVSMGLLGVIVGYALASGMTGGLVPAPAPSGTTGGTTGADVPPPTPTNETPPEVDDDASLGSDDATITMIEFTDYQCPFCSRHYTQTHGEIKKNYIDTGKVKLVVRDFPLGFHPNAQKSAEAAECAGEQDKYYEMHDVLFVKQNDWANLGAADAAKKFKEYAAEVGVNAGTFASCLDGGEMAAEVAADLAAGSASGIDGTPGFWILGPDGQNQKISGAYPYDTFKTAFDALLGG